MTQEKIIERLIRIAKMPAHPHSPFICADMVGQEELFNIQEALMKLIEKLDRQLAIEELPFMFETINHKGKEE